MVSLINFKIVNEDLQQQQYHGKDHGPERGSHDNRMFVKVMQHAHEDQLSSESSSPVTGNAQSASNKLQNSQLIGCSSQKQLRKSSTNKNNNNNSNSNENSNLTTIDHHQRTNKAYLSKPSSTNLNYPNPIQNLDNNKPVSQQVAPSFVVTWRNLRFAIEPKWHEKVANPISAVVGRAGSVNRLASVGANQCNTLASKIVLDKLDGSFKSGELTAILGPSGKCRCLFDIILVEIKNKV